MSIPGQPPTPAIPPASPPAPERRDRPFLFILAVISLASTIGAAALAGSWANRGIQDTLDRQRSAQIQDQRRVAYADFIHAAGQGCSTLGQSQDKVNAAFVEVFTQESRVLLVASEGLRGPTEKLAKYVTEIAPAAADQCTQTDYIKYRNAFITAAQHDLGS